MDPKQAQTLDKIRSRAKAFSTKVDREQGKRESVREQMRQKETHIKEIEAQEKLLNGVVFLLQKAADYSRIQAKHQIEDIVTQSIAYIMQNSSQFTVELSQSRNLPVAEFFVESDYGDYKVKTKPELSRGGGVVDIVSLALRIAFLENHRPKIQGPLFLDEPGKHISDEYIFNMGEFLKESSRLFVRQVLMVTHNEHLTNICDKAFRVEIRNGKSTVYEVIDDEKEMA
ncbi:chromosome segregation protein [Aedoeadaptatus ivorii]|uniref:Chromosome segregation protein n=1 Tax=Aedoeadaptatus ivorii TaxID=54006 RepID=A0A448V1E2_9FIRM|nr:ATPase [Peptoniphilus ivorii]VEJ35656.1 chromosome segregation protein [Peptoniphilus ivorii]